MLIEESSKNKYEVNFLHLFLRIITEQLSEYFNLSTGHLAAHGCTVFSLYSLRAALPSWSLHPSGGYTRKFPKDGVRWLSGLCTSGHV